MIRLDQIKQQSYLVTCCECLGVGILQPNVHDPRPVYVTCNSCNGTGKIKKAIKNGLAR